MLWLTLRCDTCTPRDSLEGDYSDRAVRRAGFEVDLVTAFTNFSDRIKWKIAQGQEVFETFKTSDILHIGLLGFHGLL